MREHTGVKAVQTTVTLALTLSHSDAPSALTPSSCSTPSARSNVKPVIPRTLRQESASSHAKRQIAVRDFAHSTVPHALVQ